MNAYSPPKAEAKDDAAALVKRARECLSDAIDFDRHNTDAALDDLRWLAGEQWTEEERTARDGRPTITVNLLAQFPRQVTGDIRRMNPAVNVLAADSDAAPETAEVIEGMVRHIEQASDASAIYEGAAESAAQCGIGHWRILTDYEDGDTFDQRILVKRIHNPFAVHWDPGAREATREDARWCLITEEMEAEDFEAAYPGKNAEDVEKSTAEGIENWRVGKSVTVAEYFWRDDVEEDLHLLPDGTTATGKLRQGVKPVRSRKVSRPRVMWAKVSGCDVLEGPREFPSRFIPVVAVTGEELHLGGKVVRHSVIRFAKDPQKVFNYWTSAQTEIIAVQSKAPIIGTAKQFAGLEAQWDGIDGENRAYATYNPDDKAPGPPQRLAPPVPSMAIMQEIAQARENIKASTGIYDAALGAKSNESSGIAIRQRQAESDLSTSIYSDNMGKAIAHCGRILVDMIPRVYDTPRTVRIVGTDDVEKMVQVNGSQFDPMTGQDQLINPVTAGRYDVRVTVGPNYATRRQETLEGMVQFLQAMPQAGPFMADLFVKAQEWPDADAIAGRLKAMVPPGVIPPDEMEPEEQQAMQAAQQKAQQAEQMQQAGMQAEVRKTMAEAQEKEARAMVAVADAETARMQAMQTDGGEAPQDPRMAFLELQNLAAATREILARVELIGAQTRKAEADTLKTTVEALTPPPPPQAPRAGASPAR